MHRITVPAAMLAFLLIGACAGTPAITPTPEVTQPAATATPAAPETPAPATPEVTDAPATAEPGTPGPGTGLAGNECEGMPTFMELEPGENPFTPDTELEAMFPSAIAGSSLTDLTSFRWLEFMCIFGGQEALSTLAGEVPAGFDMTNMSMATAGVQLDGDSATLGALRVPGVNMASAFQLELLGLLGAPGEDVPTGADLQQANVGGKNVFVAASDDVTSYMYAAGDVLWFVSDVSEPQAATILAALP